MIFFVVNLIFLLKPYNYKKIKSSNQLFKYNHKYIWKMKINK
jgi:hypothetical protein